MRESSTVVRGGRRWPVFTILAAVVIGIGAIAFHRLPVDVTGKLTRTSPPEEMAPPAPPVESANTEPTVAPAETPSPPPRDDPAPAEERPAPVPARATQEPPANAAAIPPTTQGIRKPVAIPTAKVREDTTATPLERTRAAAIAGDADAQFALGTALLAGDGVKPDRPRALAWFMQSASRDNAKGASARDALYTDMDDGERVRGESLSRSLEIPMPAGWLTANGTKVWAPSWYRNGTWIISMQIPARDGLAHGPGSIVLEANLYGRSSRSYEGTFTSGLLLDDALDGWKLDLLETDAYRVHVPVREEDAASLTSIWLQNEMHGLRITACPRHSPDLYAVLAPGFPVLDDDAVTDVAKKIAQTAGNLCPLDPRGGVSVTLLPAEHEPVLVKGSTAYAPVLAEVYLGGFEREVKDWSARLTNLARRAHEREQREAEEEKKKAERERQQQREIAAALARPLPVIRKLELGMTLGQVRDILGSEATSWDPEWKPDRRLPPFAQFTQSITLADQSTLSTTFSSGENGHRLLALGYEQRLREGPSMDDLRAKLDERFGTPDKESGQGSWLTWWLTSATGKPKGALLRARIQSDRASGRVSLLRLVLADNELQRQDEHQGYEARRAAERREYEQSKSDTVKF